MRPRQPPLRPIHSHPRADPESLARRSADGHVRQADLTIRAPQGACRVSPAMAALKPLAKDSGEEPTAQKCASRFCLSETGWRWQNPFLVRATLSSARGEPAPTREAEQPQASEGRVGLRLGDGDELVRHTGVG